MSLKLERTIPLIFVFVLLLLALIGGSTYRSLARTQEAMNLETHTQEVLLRLQKLQTALVDAETSVRGFMLMGDESYLQMFTNGSNQYHEELQSLRTLTHDNPAQQERLQTLQSLGDDKLKVMQQFVSVRRTTPLEQMQDAMKIAPGKILMDQIRAKVDELQQAEILLLSQRRAILQTHTKYTVMAILLGSVFGIISLAIANLVIIRQLNRRRIAEDALSQANTLLAKRVEEQSENLSKTSDELRLENIRRALAEKKEREQREWWRVTLNSIGDCVITTDTDGNINFMNQIAQEVTGWKLANAEGHPLEKIFQIVNEITHQPVESPISKVLRDGVCVGLANHTSLITKEGQYLPIDDSGAPIRDDDGNIIGAVLVFRDFSQQRLAERQLRRLEEQQRLALEAGKMGIFAWNPHTDEVQIDNRMRELFGKSPTEVINVAAPLFAAIHPADLPLLDLELKAAIENQKPYDTRFRVVLPDGKIRWIAGIGRIEIGENGNATLLRGINYDITEQVLAEQNLRRSEKHLRDVIDNLFSFVGVLLPDGTLIEANKTALEAANLKPVDVIGKHFAETYWWNYSYEVQTQLREAIQRALQGERVRFDVIVRLSEQHYIPIDFMLAPLFDEHGTVTHLIPSALDLSERRVAENKLRESEQFNRSIFENSPDCVKILELDGRLHSMNTNGLCLLEIDDFSPYIGQQWINFWEDEYHTMAKEAVAKAAQGITSNFHGFCKTAKGTHKWWDVSVAPILDSEGNPSRLISTSRDITEHKQQETALRLNEIRFRTLTETIPQLIWTCQPNGYCGYLSNRWMEYTGTTLEQNLGYGWLLAIHPDDAPHTQKLWEEAVANSTIFQTEYRLRRADGVYRWQLARAVKVNDEFGNTVKWFGTSTDIEDHKKAEAERIEILEREQVLRSKAEESNRLKDEFVATVSHELRTPLNSILGWARMLRAGTLDTATTKKAVEAIERSAENQARLIDDLLDVSRIITGKLRLDIKTIDPTIFVREALETVMPTANAKDISIHTELDPQVNLIAGDTNRLQQVVWNLLSNAIKFTPAGGHIKIQLTRNDTQVMLVVNDDGQGIAQEFLPYVFDRFRQADATSIRRHGGLGLGLAIVRHLVELHGGEITVKSPGLNLGSTFTVRLPIAPQQISTTAQTLKTRSAEKVSTEIPALNQITPILEGLFIVVVDDELDARQLLTQLLAAYGATVSAADTVAAALAIIERQQPDVLISDIGMPNHDGYSLIQKVREDEKGKPYRMPAIALTAYARPRDRMQALAVGFNHHVPKPVEPAELVTVIASLTNRLNTTDK